MTRVEAVLEGLWLDTSFSSTGIFSEFPNFAFTTDNVSIILFIRSSTVSKRVAGNKASDNKILNKSLYRLILSFAFV